MAASKKEESIIEVKHLSKQYDIGMDTTYKTLSESFTSAVRHPLKTLKDLQNQNETFWALKDVSFEVEKGEVMGIIGRNGAGKSTLLKILSRITYPTEGEVTMRGRVGSLLEVGTGFHLELSGRENIYFNGAILGMKKKEIDEKFDEIVKFSGVEKFLDTPVKRYSSGMQVRLAFSVAAHLEPEILIVDEVLAVGDAAFQKKCLGKMSEVSKGGRTVLFVSHNMQALNSLCQTAILLEQGQKVYSGPTMEAINHYLGEIKGNNNGKLEWISTDEKLPFSDIVKISRYYIQDEDGNIPVGQLLNSKKYNIVIDTEIFKSEPNLAFFISYYTEDDTLLFISDIHDAGPFNVERLSLGKKKIITSVPVHLFANRSYKIELSCVIHYKGWPLPPNNGQRMSFVFLRDNNANEMGYDEANHPFNGAGKPGLLNPVIQWEVFESI